MRKGLASHNILCLKTDGNAIANADNFSMEEDRWIHNTYCLMRVNDKIYILCVSRYRLPGYFRDEKFTALHTGCSQWSDATVSAVSHGFSSWNSQGHHCWWECLTSSCLTFTYCSCLSLRGRVVHFMCPTPSGGFDVPEGYYVFVNIWSLHHDPQQWDEPEQFRPERFLDEEGCLKPEPESWMPFSCGRRVCIGKALSKAQLPTLAAMLLHRFTFRPPPNTQLTLESEPVGAVIMPKPFYLEVERRK